MTVTVKGVGASLATADWERLGADMVTQKVITGLKVSAGASARQVSVATGRSYQMGTTASNDATFTTTLGTNTSGLTRIDTVCMKVDGTLDQATAGTIVVAAGTPNASPVPKDLAASGLQVAGGTWYTPLAYVTVVNNKTTTFTAAEIQDARPGIVSDRSKVNVSFPGNYADDTTVPMYVQAVGTGLIEYGGRFKRTTSNAARQTTATQTGVIPVGFRPATLAAVLGKANVQSGTEYEVLLEVHPNGDVDITPQGAVLANGDTVRIVTAHWIGA